MTRGARRPSPARTYGGGGRRATHRRGSTQRPCVPFASVIVVLLLRPPFLEARTVSPLLPALPYTLGHLPVVVAPYRLLPPLLVAQPVPIAEPSQPTASLRVLPFQRADLPMATSATAELPAHKQLSTAGLYAELAPIVIDQKDRRSRFSK